MEVFSFTTGAAEVVVAAGAADVVWLSTIGSAEVVVAAGAVDVFCVAGAEVGVAFAEVSTVEPAWPEA